MLDRELILLDHMVKVAKPPFHVPQLNSQAHATIVMLHSERQEVQAELALVASSIAQLLGVRAA